jgi:hypothetical protein
MVRQHPDDIQKEVDEQEDEFYGEGTVSGSAPDPEKVLRDDTAGMVENVVGNDPDDEGEDGFNLGTEVNDDEQAIEDKPIDDYMSDDGDDSATDDSDDNDDSSSDDDATDDDLEDLEEDEIFEEEEE